MREYGPCPFGASTLVAFRKRFSEQDLAAILEASVPKAATEKRDDADEGNDPPNSGTLLLDTTRCSADITYPQDIDLLNQAREKTMDTLCEAAEQKKPRTYRKCARTACSWTPPAAARASPPSGRSSTCSSPSRTTTLS